MAPLLGTAVVLANERPQRNHLLQPPVGDIYSKIYPGQLRFSFFSRYLLLRLEKRLHGLENRV